MYEQQYEQKQPQKEILFKDKKYLTGILTGFILAAIVMIGFNRYQENQILVGNLESEGENTEQPSQDPSNLEELKEKIKADVDEIQNIGVKRVMTPETPHSPQLQRLDLILREANKMVERIENDMDKMNGTQTATVSQ